jgi:hypothetical protein
VADGRESAAAQGPRTAADPPASDCDKVGSLKELAG